MENEILNQNPIEETAEVAAPSDAQVNDLPPADVDPKQKKNLKGIIIGIIAAILVGAIAVGVFLFPYIANFAIKTFSSGSAYQQYVVSKSAEDLSETLSDFIALIKSEDDKAKGADISMSIKVGEDIRAQLADNYDTTNDLSFINDLSFKAIAAVKGNLSKANLSLNFKDGSLANIEIIADSETGKQYIKIPELSSKYILIDTLQDSSINNEAISSTSAGASIVLDAIPEKEVLKGLVSKYIKLAFENIEEVDKESDSIEINGVSQNLTVLKSTIDEKDIEAILKAILREVKKDKDIEEIIKNLAKAGEADDAEAWDSFVESIDEALENIDSFSDNNELTYKLEIYVNGKGELAGFKLKDDEDSISYRTVQSGSKTAMDISIKDGDEEFKISGDGKISFGKFTGEFDIKASGEKIAKVSVKDYDIDSFKKQQLNGKFELKLTEEAADRIGVESIDGLPAIEDCKLSISFKSDSKSSSVDLALKEGADVLLGFTLESKQADASDIVVPEDAIDISEDTYEYLKTIDLDAFISKIKSSALPSDIADSLGELIKNNIDTRPYWGAIEEYTAIMYGGSYRDVAKIAPAEFFNAISGGMSMDAFTTQFIQTYETTVVPMMKSQFGDDYKVTAEFDYSYRLDADELSNMKDNINYNYNIAKDRVSEGYHVNFTLTAKGSVSEDTIDIGAYLVKVDEKWYLCNYSGEFGSF